MKYNILGKKIISTSIGSDERARLMDDLWKKASEAQRAHNYAVHEATKVFNKTKRETGKEDHVTFEAAIAPTREAYDKAYAAAKEKNSKEAEA